MAQTVWGFSKELAAGKAAEGQKPWLTVVVRAGITDAHTEKSEL